MIVYRLIFCVGSVAILGLGVRSGAGGGGLGGAAAAHLEGLEDGDSGEEGPVEEGEGNGRLERPAPAPVAAGRPEPRGGGDGAREPEDDCDGEHGDGHPLVEEGEAVRDEEVGDDQEGPDGAEDEEVVRRRGRVGDVGDVAGQAEDDDREDGDDAGEDCCYAEHGCGFVQSVLVCACVCVCVFELKLCLVTVRKEVRRQVCDREIKGGMTREGGQRRLISPNTRPVPLTPRSQDWYSDAIGWEKVQKDPGI